jgi:transposase
MSTDNVRQQRGLELARRLRIVQNPSGTWAVPSETTSKNYVVTPDEEAPSCSCPDFELNRQPCKHVYAVRALLAGLLEEPAETPEPATPKRPTYPQVWSAYNRAQTEEKGRFRLLLHEMCRGLREPVRDRPKGGRPPLPLADVVFAACFKVYSTFSGRRFMTDLRDAQARGYLTRAPHYNSIFSYLESAELTPTLRALVTVSSLPLKTVDVDFATDSTGFATSRFVRWYDEKYGKQRRRAMWVKVHATVGVRTNVVTAVEIHGPDAGDAPQFPALLGATARNFSVREASADKAYSSLDNLQAAVDVGAAPYIPFRANTTDERGGLWAEMFHYFCENRDTFMRHYHKRSNAESTFSAIKAKFGDAVRSKTDVAMKNEVLCKVVCFNICCVIQEMHELGIDPVFWEGEAKEDAVILPLTRGGLPQRRPYFRS